LKFVPEAIRLADAAVPDIANNISLWTRVYKRHLVRLSEAASIAPPEPQSSDHRPRACVPRHPATGRFLKASERETESVPVNVATVEKQPQEATKECWSMPRENSGGDATEALFAFL
jgi:hypothetical protein